MERWGKGATGWGKEGVGLEVGKEGCESGLSRAMVFVLVEG